MICITLYSFLSNKQVNVKFGVFRFFSDSLVNAVFLILKPKYKVTWS